MLAPTKEVLVWLFWFFFFFYSLTINKNSNRCHHTGKNTHMMSRERKHLFLECTKELKFGKNNTKGFIHQEESLLVSPTTSLVIQLHGDDDIDSTPSLSPNNFTQTTQQSP